jgi:ATP/maltotriose-dependent transcriptional regulator MalT
MGQTDILVKAKEQDTTLILDDYHLLSEPAIHESLQFMLNHLAPCVHLLLAGRVDPHWHWPSWVHTASSSSSVRQTCP